MKTPDRSLISAREDTRRPGHCLDHHVVTVCEQPFADQESALCVASASVGLRIQRHGADERRTPPPAVWRRGPRQNQNVVDPFAVPGPAREVQRKAIDLVPAAHACAQLDDLLRAQRLQSTWMIDDHLIAEEPMHALLASELETDVNDEAPT